jgi:2-polyprenyl-6-methoxyphenol hydroxylase-like FAD-dependent oxidoreductase
VNQPRALVIGGSLSGLFTANLLRTIGWHVDVFERTHSDLTGRGAGLGAQADLFAAMRRIGIQIDRSMWTEVRSHICLDQNGKTICEVPVREVTTAWDRVYRALRQAFSNEHYHGGMTLVRCEQKERRVVAVFANGVRAEADLLVGADGMRSTVRRQFMPEIAPRYVGYVAWRGVVEESQIPLHWRTKRSTIWFSACRPVSWRSQSRWQLTTMWVAPAAVCSCGSVRLNTHPPCGSGALTRRDIVMEIPYHRL